MAVDKPYNTFTFNGIESDTYGIRISGNGVFNAPARNYSMVQIPGRNGDLIIDNGRYDNIDVTYPAIILPENYANNKLAIRNWLLSAKGYKRLEDTYNPDEYRLAVYKEPVNISDLYFTAGGLQITFNCRPERFLKTGDAIRTITTSPGVITNNGVTINNTTYSYPSKPLIKIVGYGQLKIRDGANTKSYYITVQEQFDYVYVDCDSMICYYGTTNANQYVSIDEFPELVPGQNVITFPSTITSVEVTPRWWRL